MAWLDFNPSTSGRPAECSWNSDFTPNGGQPARDSLPVSNVDWCDAQAYCHDADKHLCGAVGGGSIGYSQYLSGFTSEWYIACSAGGAHQYPYGDTLSNGTCADTNASVAVGTKSGCVGGYAGIYDMSGNVAEWIDSCQPNTFDGGAGADSCRILGGSFSPVTGNLTCGDDKGINRNTTAGAVGFRCCK
jgi:formylglycine-generating enzyme required for sulfatase activity